MVLAAQTHQLAAIYTREPSETPRGRALLVRALALGIAVTPVLFAATPKAFAQDAQSLSDSMPAPVAAPATIATPMGSPLRQPVRSAPSAVASAPTPATASAANAAAPSAQAENPIAFEADTVEYAQDNEKVTASGNVVLRRTDDKGQEQSVRADTVTWDRNSGQVLASGNVRLVDQDGNQIYTEQVQLTDELKTGMMENLLLVMREGGRLAANSGERLPNGDVVLNQAAYTGCDVITADGCDKKPSWRIIAKRVIYSDSRRRVSFKDARIEFLGLVQIPLVGMSISTNGGSVSGFLMPDFRSSPSNGIEIANSYYWRLADNRDLTSTLSVFTQAAPMAQVEYRALTSKGTYQITGYATSSSKIPLMADSGSSLNGKDRSFRGYIFANGKFQLDENWSVTGSIRRATDRTFLRRYDISRDDRLRSMIDVERIDQDSYFSFAGYTTQTMQYGRDQGKMPVALPIIDYRRRFQDPILGGKLEAQFNTMGIQRSDGQDTQRGTASGQWTLSKLTGMGQQITFTGLVRGDVYHSDENEKTATVIYRGKDGWQARGIATAAVDVQWPLVGQIFGGSQVLTPRFQMVASPQIRNFDIPNEDSRAFELDTGNIFSLNRFPGHDRVEDGVRFTYGFDWQFEKARWQIRSTVGQSIRLSNQASILPDGTGLSRKMSDIVGRTEVRYRDFVKFVHHFRLDKDNLSFRRNEFDAVVGNTKTYLEVGYTKLNRDIVDNFEDLQDREEVRAAGRVAFARYWALFGSAVINMTSRAEDPINGSDGFQPLRTRIGASYEDDCMSLALTWRRDYVALGDVKRGDSFQVHFTLKNIGTR